ncbi:SAM-dependent methyltransferase [Azospirillum halopraeferens]|uniref:SAM-dependent methyltransferase n=1 Tax=Azospirillum halopraeferens TaxID=34010 RepID=UPI0004068C37|nr:class I SAM-dependent methyltransferase [Azospirillum halopraeferens]
MDDALFFALHEGLPRQAPGSDAVTQDAVRRLRAHGLPDDPEVLDIGCGPGRSLMMLARVTGGRVTGIDIHEPFLGEAQRRIDEAGLGRRARVERRSMLELDALPAERFDLLWGEGSIYIAGFDAGLERWRRLLRPGGLAAFSELTWLTEAPPAEARAFWADAYPAMRTEAANRAAAERLGWRVLDTVTLPDSAWWDEYYRPLEARIAEWRERYPGDAARAAVLDAEAAEIDLRRRFGAGYGYVFYLLRRMG